MNDFNDISFGLGDSLINEGIEKINNAYEELEVEAKKAFTY